MEGRVGGGFQGKRLGEPADLIPVQIWAQAVQSSDLGQVIGQTRRYTAPTHEVSDTTEWFLDSLLLHGCGQLRLNYFKFHYNGFILLYKNERTTTYL